MANILYMAISKDGFIAGLNDETPWSDESWESFQSFVTSCDVILLGKRTFNIMKAQDEFIKGPRYVVVTHDKNLNTGDYPKIAIDAVNDMPQAHKVGIIGGGELNGSLAMLRLIDEIILDTEPATLHKGIRLFGKHNVTPKMQKISSRNLSNSITQVHYKVVGWE